MALGLGASADDGDTSSSPSSHLPRSGPTALSLPSGRCLSKRPCVPRDCTPRIRCSFRGVCILGLQRREGGHQLQVGRCADARWGLSRNAILGEDASASCPRSAPGTCCAVILRAGGRRCRPPLEALQARARPLSELKRARGSFNERLRGQFPVRVSAAGRCGSAGHRNEAGAPGPLSCPSGRVPAGRKPVSELLQHF